MYRATLVIVAAGLILAAGFLHGRIIDRWGDSHEMTDAVTRLKTLKPAFGDWTSKTVEMNPKHLQLAEIMGNISRQYVNQKTGETVSILLICGRPGPISVHTPDVCYEGAGYKMGHKSQQPIKEVSSSRVPTFWAARFVKEPEPAPLHIMWAWSNGGLWVAPDNPRLTFYQSKVLYKLYIVRSAKQLDAPLVDEVTHAFLKDFYPVLQEILPGHETQTAQ